MSDAEQDSAKFRLFGYGMDTTNLPAMASAPKRAG
jgi:hypothetical protein